VREAIQAEIRVQVDEQIQQYLLVSLRQQAETTKQQLHQVRIALQNSCVVDCFCLPEAW